MRRGAAAAALVEQHDAVARGIVIAAHHRVRAAAGSAMQQHGRLAGRVAAFLEIDLVQRGDLEPSRAVGNDLGVKAHATARLCLTLVHGEAILHDFSACWEKRLLACRGRGSPLSALVK